MATVTLRSLAASRAVPVSALSVMGPLFSWDPAAYIFWFVFGIVAGGHVGEFNAGLLRIRKVVPALLALSYGAALVEWEILRRASGRPWISGGVTLSDNVLSFAILVTFFALYTQHKRCDEVLSRIGYMSYGVYLMHVSVLLVTAKAVYHTMPSLLSCPIVLQVSLILAGVGVPVYVMMLVNASPLRRYYRYVFG